MRLYPRAKQDIPVIFKGKFTGSTATLSNLSLGSAFLRGQLLAQKVGDALSLKYYLQGYGYLEHRGRATRKNHEGVAVAFYALDSPTKVKLWGYIEERLKHPVRRPGGDPGSQGALKYLKLAARMQNTDSAQIQKSYEHKKAAQAILDLGGVIG